MNITSLYKLLFGVWLTELCDFFFSFFQMSVFTSRKRGANVDVEPRIIFLQMNF